MSAILGRLSLRERAALRWAWGEFWLRPDAREPGARVGSGQRNPPGRWIWSVHQGGRGSGKSTACVIAFCEDADRMGRAFVGAILCQTPDEARKMLEDEASGLPAMRPPWARPRTEWSKEGGKLTWPSGAVAHIYSAEQPRKGRAPNFNRWLIDDPPKFGLHGLQVFNALARGFRLQGHGLRCWIATTPPGDPPPTCPELLDFLLSKQNAAVGDPKAAGWVFSISASDDNLSNLDDDHKAVLRLFEGSEAEAAERGGVYDPEGGAKVFRTVNFAAPPVAGEKSPIKLARVTIAIDPNKGGGDEIGIVAAGTTDEGHAWLLEDASGKHTSRTWPEIAHALFDRWEPLATSIRFLLEVNVGAKDCALLELAEIARRRQVDPHAAGVAMRQIVMVTAREGKAQRASSLVLLYEAGHVHHRPGLGAVEAQLKKLDPAGKGADDRADAAVYALLDVLGGMMRTERVYLGGGKGPAPAGAFGPPAQGSAIAAPVGLGMTMSTPERAGPGAFGRAGW